MSWLRFNHVFGALMLLSALGAFVMSSDAAAHAPQIAALFVPVSRPSAAIAGFFHDRIAPDPLGDQRSTEAIRRENRELKAQLQSLTVQVEELRALNGERNKLGPIGDLCTVVGVAGYDAGLRESLQLRGSSLEGVRDGQAVLYTGGIIGLISRSGLAGAQVRLITDPGFRVRASIAAFGRRVDNQITFSRRDVKPALFEGKGSDRMVAENLTFEQLEKGNVQLGDQVILTDSDWPTRLQGRPLGRIVSITPRQHAPLFASITIQPLANLQHLSDVMVLTKER